jgi:hypothetical protein
MSLTVSRRELAIEFIASQFGLPAVALREMTDEVITQNLDKLYTDGGYEGWLQFTMQCELQASHLAAELATERIDPLRAAVRELTHTITPMLLVSNPELPESSRNLVPYKLVTRLQPYESVKAAEVTPTRCFLVMETAETKTSRGRDFVKHSLRLIVWEMVDNGWRVESDFSTVVAHSEYVLRGRTVDLAAYLHQRRQELDNLRRQFPLR